MMKDIPGYENLYAVTDDGRVWSYRSGIFLKPAKDKDGYYKVTFSINDIRRTYSIHRLMAYTYLPDYNEELQVNHKNEIKGDNRLENLAMVTAKENTNYGTSRARSVAKRNKSVHCIETNIIYSSISEATRQTGINNGDISRVCNGIRKIAGGCHWQFVESK